MHIFLVEKKTPLYVLKTHFDCFNSQVNNLHDILEDKEDNFFIDIKEVGEETLEPKLIHSKYVKNIT